MNKSNVLGTVYTPQSFCDEFLGVCPVFYGDKDELKTFFQKNGRKDIQIYPMEDIHKVLDVKSRKFVLVDTTWIDEDGDEAEQVPEYSWVSVPTPTAIQEMRCIHTCIVDDLTLYIGKTYPVYMDDNGNWVVEDKSGMKVVGDGDYFEPID